MNLYQLAFLASTNPTDNMFQKMMKPAMDLINMAIVPALTLVGSIGAIYCILLGVKLAKADEPQERDKAKNSLKNALVGFILIFILMMALRIGGPLLTDWATQNISNT